MFTLNHILRQSILDEGAPEGGQEQQQDQSSILDDNASIDNATQDMNVEQFLAGFAHEDKESASKYANNYVDEQGNLDVSKMIKSGFSIAVLITAVLLAGVTFFRGILFLRLKH